MKELYKLSSAPLVWFIIKPSASQPSTNNLYGEVLAKQYYNGKEMRAYYDNPTLQQSLLTMGIEIPEQIVIYVDSQKMLEVFGEPIPIGTVIKIPHQRNQYYTVENSLPYQSSQRFFKYQQWILTCNKEQLEGKVLPAYLELGAEYMHSWITFGDNYMTEFLSDRLAKYEQRQYLILGDLDYFWNMGGFYEDIEVGNFNGYDNYCNFGNTYNMALDSFSLSIFLKPDMSYESGYQSVSGVESGWDDMPILNKGDEFDIRLLGNNKIQVKLGSQTFTSKTKFLTGTKWNQLTIVVDRTLNKLTIYRDTTAILPATSLSRTSISNSDDFIIGKDSNDFYYRGYMSNLRILNKIMSPTDVSVENTNLISRSFYSL